MIILYVTPYVPSRIRTRPYNLIRALVGLGHHVTLLTAATTSPEEQAHADKLRDWGVRVEVFPVSLARSLSNCLLALPTREPLQAVYSYHPAMERRLSELMKEHAFDVVHIEHLRAARLVRAVGHTPVVYDSVDCISLLFEQAAQGGAQLRSRLMTAVDLARTRRYEARLLTRYNQVVVTSRRDKEALEGLAHRYLSSDTRTAPITVVTNGVDLEYFHPPETRFFRKQSDKNLVSPPTIVFTGKMSYHANVAAALYFARDVLPLIWERDPRVRLQIVGQDPPEAVRQLAADERVEVTGTVDDLRPYLAQATVAVCPVPYAVGVQFKVLEAMAMETPVVCTSAAFAGLEAQRGKEALVADGPEAFATQILRICSDPILAERLSSAGRRYVETHHSWKTGARRLEKVYERARSETSKKRV
ncbi:MAG: glycosyl transferase family 1 [Chloroflexi bacterium]|nr:MAG: glycosyl transferase family 1 [Chloroflexota bacterium]